MLTVAEINQTFQEKGLLIKLPLPPEWQVKKMDVLERKKLPGGVGVLLNVTYVDDSGYQKAELFYCEGELKTGPRKPVARMERQVKEGYLPRREEIGFTDEAHAFEYLRTGMAHLLEDKGCSPAPAQEGADLHLKKDGQGFFGIVVLRFDDAALEKARALVEMRGKQGPQNEYGLVAPAFQEPLGLPLRQQEGWVARNQEYLSTHRIGVYGVDNLDPNRIFPYTIYPKPRELMRYFLYTAQAWHMARSRFVESRTQRE
ncbi:MAG: hypothetical protein QGF81_04015 [Dehalococcoidia bacterium]|nr:hypothetical protein [Dehalococcoidia bacterium]